MANLYALADQFRQRLADRDARTAEALLRAYDDVLGRLDAALLDLTQEIERAAARGETISQSWLFRRDRLETLQREARQQMDGYADAVTERVTRDQAAVVVAAQTEAAELVTAAYATAPEAIRAAVAFNALPASAVESLVGFASNGTPLRALLDGFGEHASQAMRRELVAGIAQGWNPKRVAKQLRAHLDEDAARALTIARTEMGRAQLESTRRLYEANADIVPRWRWTCGKQARTCACCLALDGREFPVSEPMRPHPNCRCVMTPVRASWEELGFAGVPDTRKKRETGAEWLARQPAKVQRKVLGVKAQAAYASGEVELGDFIAVRDDAEWGPMYYAAPLQAARKAAEQR